MLALDAILLSLPLQFTDKHHPICSFCMSGWIFDWEMCIFLSREREHENTRDRQIEEIHIKAENEKIE